MLHRDLIHRGRQYRIRIAEFSDVPSIRVLVNMAYAELAELGLNYTATYQDEQVTWERMNQGRAYVLEFENQVIGTVLFSEKNYFTQKKSAYVSQLAIHPSLKRLGLGSILMDLCEELANSEKYAAIQLDTAKPAHHLVEWYLKRGYKQVGQTHWEGKTYESWIFEKDIEGSVLLRGHSL